MESDEIHFIIGTRINIAHQDPNLPVDLEIRRTVVKRIARLLEEKWLKKVTLNISRPLTGCSMDVLRLYIKIF